MRMLRLMNNLPNRRYYSVGEVCQFCDLKPYTLRYWEKKAGMILPIRIGGRRYYTKNAIQVILQLKQLVRNEGYAVSDAVERLEQGLPDSSDYQSILSQIDAILSE